MKRLVAKFLLFGCVGLLAATAAYLLGMVPALHRNLVFTYTMLALAPASILGLAEPTSVGEAAFLLALVFGFNFVLYGLVGLMLFGIWSLFRPHRHKC